MRKATMVLIGVLIPFHGFAGAADRALTFEERVRAQGAIDRVYHAHQIGATRRFEEAVPRAALEAKVRKSLRESLALQRFWGRGLTADDLRSEMERIFRETRLPRRLMEIFHALGDDTFLFQECVARAAIVDRRIRALFESDGAGSGASWDRWWTGVEGTLDPAAVPAVAGSGPRPAMRDAAGTLAPATCAADDTWDPGALDDSPDARFGHTAVWTGSQMILWGGGATGTGSTTPGSGRRYDPLTNVWTSTSLANAPTARTSHTAVWTGSRMIVWGGSSSDAGALNTGGVYDPISDTWSPTSLINAPTGRSTHKALWTGSRMIVWGGANDGSGGRYDPGTNTWMATSTAGAPTGIVFHSAVWTGARMMVWGGLVSGGGVTNTGGLYDPVGDTWSPTAVTSHTPDARYGHAAVWTGSQVIVWGGSITSSRSPTNTGGRYDPASNKWTETRIASETPSVRTDMTAVWTGSEMIVWGGFGTTTYLSDGGRYRPDQNSWSALSASPLSARKGHTMIWDGSRLIIYGGQGSSATADGARYNPADDSWTALPLGPAPAFSGGQSLVWTGSEMIAWGGISSGTSTAYLDSGSRYDPALDHWTPMNRVNAPAGRGYHSAVWTGEKMAVWGGQAATGLTATGGLYDPASDSWSPISESGAPAPRREHTAMWTGSKMIVWGGWAGSDPFFASGGRYDPLTDVWQPTALTGAPSARINHSAIWTGETMIVWGGLTRTGPSGTQTQTNTGASYDPASNAWTPTDLGWSLPYPRERHSAVWTGTEMIVFGGWNLNPGPFGETLSSGARYDPFRHTWKPIADAPQAKFSHSAVWTGTEMMVWGGGTGERYDPATNTWHVTSTYGAPPSSSSISIVWSGDFVLAWASSPRTGSRYAIDTDRDGLPNECDPDSDGDSVEDAADCSPYEASVSAAPSEVTDVTVEAAPGRRVMWTAQAGSRYDVAGGSIESLRNAGGVGSGYCVADNIFDSTWDDIYPGPLPGDGNFYLVRAENSCGRSTYGTSSSGVPRVVSNDCP